MRLGSVTALAQSNFTSAGVFIEKCITQARHVEVQLFGDGKGNVVILGDRDCSLQRRNQKLVEECPAPQLPTSIRASMHESARALAASVNYASAGTVEFLYDAQAEQYYFLEVNTRLQVEHGVSELVYGVDIVEWMIRLAVGDLPNCAELEQSVRQKARRCKCGFMQRTRSIIIGRRQGPLTCCSHNRGASIMGRLWQLGVPLV